MMLLNSNCLLEFQVSRQIGRYIGGKEASRAEVKGGVEGLGC